MTAQIHRYWEGPPDELEHWTRRTVAAMHPAARLRMWTPHHLPADVKRRLDDLAPAGPEGAPDVPGRRHRSNIARYLLLQQSGGLWLDADVIPLADLTASDKPWTAALGSRRENSVLWFPRPEHPLLAAMLTAIADADPALPVPERSGSRLLNVIGMNFPTVLHEPRVLPFDAAGDRTTVNDRAPLAVHLWSTTSKAIAR